MDILWGIRVGGLIADYMTNLVKLSINSKLRQEDTYNMA